MKRLFINELNNMRDLGGYTTLNGTTTKYNRFIRSEWYYNNNRLKK